MKAITLTDGPPRQQALVFETGDEVVSTLTGWARSVDLPAASFTAIGAFAEATLGFYDLEEQRYLEIPVDSQAEVLTLAGDITLDADGGWQVHGHVVCGLRDGSTVGGHLLRAVTRPTLEMVVTTSPTHLRRRPDPASGLALIDPDAG
ncbi:DNA-binding protein [Blastococcus sp. MG754426]|uniref:PPC domain-containing DNA-binding protein n=1 Tax=unclassified Blastococcus TaxID=2619396 RepID=UPI001EF0FA7A|nr:MULTISPECIES: PPC domain-containing DNA-binding protein [unclassified Blastococcus]MCF6506070.1 DNA-binding protein [Blastococcus sp. MG754426]MCF6510544.1 DNA-binding protein [Blastococcus sp. MG754427]